MPLEPHDIKRAAQAVDAIESIDKIINWMAKDVDGCSDEWGQKVRDIFGRNRLHKFKNSYLGEVTFCAVINALLEERAEIFEDNKDVVELPSPPCPTQHPNSRD